MVLWLKNGFSISITLAIPLWLHAYDLERHGDGERRDVLKDLLVTGYKDLRN